MVQQVAACLAHLVQDLDHDLGRPGQAGLVSKGSPSNLKLDHLRRQYGKSQDQRRMFSCGS